MYAWIIEVFVYGATDIISEFKVNVSIQYDPHYTIMCRGVDLFSEKKTVPDEMEFIRYEPHMHKIANKNLLVFDSCK